MSEKKPIFSVTKKDFRVDYYRGSGPGGQKKNKTSSACRITHIETGLQASSEESRSQPENKAIAFKKLVNKPEFQLWLKKKVFEAEHDLAEIERKVDEMVETETKCEVKSEEGTWVVYEEKD